MELREFAEQVLFATTLEEKLRAPGELTDHNRGTPIVTPVAPGRPVELRFKPTGTARGEFPGTRHLEQPHERGRLLHFFANHELLATELMALVLLRFPEAPAAFRQGVLRTLQDEQEHTKLYLARMRPLGMQFGELPVSGYFWRAVAGMGTPMDYVAGLSLTFEQANLDFARHFSQRFTEIGDADSARLLDRIYHDEIAHVAYGLKWFRRWKNPSESDWVAFCGQLKFPLSPQRAKGLTLNVEGRRAAGFDRAFIAELKVYSQSRGRTPTVFVFNPFTEEHLALGRRFTPAKPQLQLARDLTNLPQFLCQQDDIVLVERRPSVEFLSVIQEAGFPLPEFVELNRCDEPSIAAGSAFANAITERKKKGIAGLVDRKLANLRPWAWGPESMRLFEPLFPALPAKRPGLAPVNQPVADPSRFFNAKIARLYSKAWSAEFLSKVLSRWSQEPWLCPMSAVGITVKTLEEALQVIAAIRQRGHHRLVIKQTLGLAGHNAIRLWEPELLDPQRRWMESAVENGRELIIEPWLERELDFSIQLEMGTDKLSVVGYTGLTNDRKGQFQANWAMPNWARHAPAQVTAPVGGSREQDRSRPMEEFYADVFSLLEGELKNAGYLGPLGIDAFTYRTPQGACLLKPIVEINPRYTMGRLTLELMKRTCPGSQGLFRLCTRRMVREEGFADFIAYAQFLSKRFPVVLKGEPVGRISSGTLCLNDPTLAGSCLATFQVTVPRGRIRTPPTRIRDC